MNHLEQTKIIPCQLKNHHFLVNAFAFIAPKEKYQENYKAIFTHGYTASKSDLISWASRLADSGISSLIFDLPGHYLGSYNRVESFTIFTEFTHHLFYQAMITLKDLEKNYYPATSDPHYFLGGHSLGALMAVRSSLLPDFVKLKKTYIGVGFGLNEEVKTHLFDTDFYSKTLNIRKQLVAPEITSDLMFPWIRSMKRLDEIKDQNICIITGVDDVVVGKDGAKNLANNLSTQNTVELIEPSRLPHHQPELAASHIYSYIKQQITP